MNRTQVRVLAGIFVIVAVVIFYPVFTQSQTPGRGAVCQSNLKQIGLALMQYRNDYDDHYPLVVRLTPKSSQALNHGSRPYGYGWAEGYLTSMKFLQCPAELSGVTSTNATARGYTDYWFNSNLSGFDEGKILNPALVITNGDGNDGTDLTDARYAISALPRAWIANPRSPLYRHIHEKHFLFFRWQQTHLANYLFADGHVKALTPDEVSTVAANSPSLSLR